MKPINSYTNAQNSRQEPRFGNEAPTGGMSAQGSDPEFEALVDEIADETTDVKVGKINIDEQPELAARYGVMSIPTLMVFSAGEIKEKAVGARPKAAILKLLGK